MADLSKIKLNGTEYDLKDAVTRIELENKANTADLASVAFSGSYNDLSDKPSGNTKPVYNLNFQGTIGTMTRYTLSNPKEDIAETISDISTGNANFVRQFNLTYDPIEQSQMPADASVFGEYKFLGLISNRYVYQRIMSFSNTFDNPYIDELGIQISGTTISVFHSYRQLFDAVIIVIDGNWKSQSYPHAITTFSSTGGLWGSQNLVSVKKARAGYASQFNFKLRVNTHNDNVWLSPVETISANSLPRFIGESKKLGKKIIVTFDDFTNTDHPTGTIDMEDLVEPQIQVDWNQTDETAVDFIKNKPTAVSAFINDAGYLTGHQDISGKANTTDLPLIITSSCNFTSSLTSGVDTPLEVTNVSKTYADIAEAVSNNRPVKMIVSNSNLKVSLDLTAFDGNIYYFTNSYDPFTGMANGVDNESFNITVRAERVNDNDVFTWIITYNKNVFAKKSEVQTQINEAIGGITEFDTQVVQSLPQTGVEGTIYFTPNNHGINDAYDEFIYVNDAWEKIGNTQVDLTGYVRTSDLPLVATSGDYNNLNNTPNIPEKTSDLTNDSGFVNADTAQDIAWLNFDGTYITDPWKMSELGPLTGNDVYAEYVMTKKAVPIVIYNNSLYYYQSGNSNTDIKYFNPENNTILTHSNNSSIVSINTRTIFSGDYNDLSNKPTLFDGDYNSLSNKPTLFSGSYNDLSDKPTIPSATVVTQTISSGVKIAEINGTAIYAPAYANGDQIAY